MAELHIPKRYWIAVERYLCKSCGTAFTWRVASGGEIVRFVSTDGREESWLPTYGPGGYLDLIGKIVPGFDQGSEIGVIVVRRFTEQFATLQSEGGQSPIFVLDERGPACPKCGGKELYLADTKVETNPPIKWLRYPEPGNRKV